MKRHDTTKPPQDNPKLRSRAIAHSARDAADAMFHYERAVETDHPRAAAKALNDSLKCLNQAKSAILAEADKIGVTLPDAREVPPWEDEPEL